SPASSRKPASSGGVREMPKVETFPTLSTGERDRRWALTRDFLRDEGLSALIVAGDSGPFRMQPYLANTTRGAILFPLDSPPVALAGWFDSGRFFENARRGIEPWIEDSRIIFDTVSDLAMLVGERGLQG